MFLGIEGFGSSPFLWSCYTPQKIDSLEVSNGIYDEIKIDETLTSTNSIEKEKWTIDTVLLADYKNSLEAGNIFGVNPEIPIQYLRFKRRKVGELNWQIMVDVPFYKDIENYNLVDYYIKSSVDMEYSVVPVTQSIEGNGTVEKVETNYKSLFLTGKDNEGNIVNYPLRFDLELSNVVLNEDKVIQKTLSSKYPAILCGESKYYSGSVKCSLISPTTEQNYGEVNMKAENIYRDTFEEFIHNGKPMLIRNHSFYVLGVISDIKKDPIFGDDCAWGIWNYNFTFTQVNDANNLNILKANNLDYNVKTN